MFIFNDHSHSLTYSRHIHYMDMDKTPKYTDTEKRKSIPLSILNNITIIYLHSDSYCTTHLIQLSASVIHFHAISFMREDIRIYSFRSL